MAQRITQPQMAVGLVVAVQHVAVCYLLINRTRLGFLGAAVASGWSNLLSVALLAAYVAVAGMGEQVWGRPSREAFARWRQFAGLAYASAGEWLARMEGQGGPGGAVSSSVLPHHASSALRQRESSRSDHHSYDTNSHTQ